ncbi:helix-turn-helix transcriptional regulator [Halomonas smyrnensis]|uniref:helix-turn-helix transcriptional regulator n=1 Tax=Halomonas smyrnensis TaxID=720605 RepID=UPI0009FD09FD|nr:AlpA family phage regulatory protein [Halomonas smyrnensis]
MTYLTVKQLAARYSASVPTIWRWSRDSETNFPKPVKLSSNCTRWKLEDIEAWEAERGAA